VILVGNGIFAIYKGREFKANRRGNKIVLISEDKNDNYMGFQYDPFSSTYELLLDKADLEKLYTKTLCCNYKGDTFVIADEKEDKYLLMSGPRSYLLSELGFEQTDRGEYQKWVQKNEVTNEFNKIKDRN
jgi:hypothetical protein